MADFDLIIIGGGPGGYVAAIRAAQLGMKTALVEKMESLGGTCLNIGCIPSKALIYSGSAYQRLLKEFPEHGIEVENPILNLKKLMSRKEDIVKKLTSGVAGLIKGNKIQRFNGTAVLRPGKEHRVDIYENPHSSWAASLGAPNYRPSASASSTADAPPSAPAPPSASAAPPDQPNSAPAGKGRESITAKRVLLATGSLPVELSELPFDGKNIVSSAGALSFNTIPKSLIIVGAGAIGVEMAFIWASLGTKVTIIEMMKQILPGWDSQISRVLQRELKQLGIEYIFNTCITGFKSLKTGITLNLESGELRAEKLLAAAGRRADIQSAGIQEAGIKLTDDNTSIAVDADYQTNVSGVYAIGDIVPGLKLAHKAEDEALVAVERMNGIPAHLNYEAIPSIVYTVPEAASVGYSEDQLKSSKREYKKGVFNIAGNGRALTMGVQSGFVKILTDPKTDKILGAHIVGPDAGDLISEIVTVMEMKGSSEDIARIVHAHPTLSEAVKEAALAVHGRSLHSLKR